MIADHFAESTFFGSLSLVLKTTWKEYAEGLSDPMGYNARWNKQPVYSEQQSPARMNMNSASNFMMLVAYSNQAKKVFGSAKVTSIITRKTVYPIASSTPFSVHWSKVSKMRCHEVDTKSQGTERPNEPLAEMFQTRILYEMIYVRIHKSSAIVNWPKDVTVLHRSAPPSNGAAGNDIDKIIRADDPDRVYTDLAAESIQLWRDSKGLFAGLYHRSGWLMSAGQRSLPFFEDSIKTGTERGFEQAPHLTNDEVRGKFPAYDGDIQGWRTYWNIPILY
ncbi:hypothetical protein AC579_5751 [Pseudocercospora musae]|uniref:Uncharacterized protein n=1 Tax=Pseudocercospora musae TaxID=113226 RepID=A0A139IRM0_9PEZI|nr:hypothetical protein AC579_5751 [Pseudocercospora musae]